MRFYFKKINIIFLITFLFLCIFLISCPDGGSGGSGGSSSGSDDDTEITSFKTIVDSAGGVGGFTSMAVDGSYIYISYYDNTNGNLKFAKSTNGGLTWSPSNITTVDSAEDVGLCTSLTVNGLNVYISYYDNINGDLKVARSTDGGDTWDLTIVDSVGYVGLYTSIAVNGSNVYISYYDNTYENLKLAKSTDSGDNWYPLDIRTLDSTGIVGKHTSIAVNGSNVYISYYDGTNGNLKFAKSTNGGHSGTITTVDSDICNVGEYTSIAVDSSNIYISYYDETNGDLKFARSTDSGDTWVPTDIKTVDSAESIGEYTSIAIDGSYVYISYYDETNGDLKFARSVDRGNTW